MCVSRVTVDKDFMEACHYIKDHMTAVSSPDKEMVRQSPPTHHTLTHGTICVLAVR